MKKLYLFLTILITMIAVAGCGLGGNDAASIKVGTMSVPQAEILKQAEPIMLNEHGVKLEIVEFDNYEEPNHALNDKKIDANFFQHLAFMNNFMLDHENIKLAKVGTICLAPMGIYSYDIASLSDLPENATIAIPNDPTNIGRSLLLLEKAGVIKLREGLEEKSTVYDIIDDPKYINFRQVASDKLTSVLDEVDAAVINCSFAMKAGLDPTEDSLFIEDISSPYANIIAVRQGDEKLPKIQALIKVLKSDEMRTFINNKYQGMVVPTF